MACLAARQRPSYELYGKCSNSNGSADREFQLVHNDGVAIYTVPITILLKFARNCSPDTGPSTQSVLTSWVVTINAISIDTTVNPEDPHDGVHELGSQTVCFSFGYLH